MQTPKPQRSRMRLYSEDAQRLYLNAEELERFLHAADKAAPEQRLLAYTLAYTGVRLSEARTLRFGAIQLESRVLAVQSLKKRRRGVVREVPIPNALAALLPHRSQDDHELIWPIEGRPVPRSTAYRWIKRLMFEAGISGPRACPKGLRHAYGVRATLGGVPLHMLQRWMGHASMETTAIYATVLGADQLKLADRMW